MDMITLAMAKPKVIDLAKYEVDETPAGVSIGTTLNGVVLSLFSSGGGSGAVVDNSSFWNDVNTNSPLSFAIDASDISPGITITADANSITAGNGVPYAIEFSFLVQVQAWSKVTVVFGNNFNGTTQITVIAESLTITGA